MKGHLLANIYVGNAVAISERKVGIVLDVRNCAADAPSGLSGFASLDQRDAPRFGCLSVNFHAVLSEVEGHVRGVKEIIGEVFLDHVTLVAEADYEVVGPKRAIDLHDMPKNRAPPDFDHRFRPDRRFFGNAGALSAREYDHFH